MSKKMKLLAIVTIFVVLLLVVNITLILLHQKDEPEMVETTEIYTVSESTEGWVMPTNPTDFHLEVKELEEKAPSEGEATYDIAFDTDTITVPESSLATYDGFISDEMLQSMVQSLLFDIDAVYLVDTFESATGFCSVQVDCEDIIFVVIDGIEGTATLKYE